MADSQHAHISWNDAVLWGLSIKQYIDVTHEGYTAAQKALMQIAVMYLLPSWQPDTLYRQGSIIRVAGKVYKALRDTYESPVAIVTSEDGTPLTTDNPWQMLIDHDVNDGNWANLDLDLIINAASLPEQLQLALYKINEWDGKISLDYTDWKDQKEADFAAMLTRKEAEFAPLYTEALKTINEQGKIISEQAVLIEKQADLLDQFSRATFLVDSFRPKEQS